MVFRKTHAVGIGTGCRRCPFGVKWAIACQHITFVGASCFTRNNGDPFVQTFTGKRSRACLATRVHFLYVELHCVASTGSRTAKADTLLVLILYVEFPILPAGVFPFSGRGGKNLGFRLGNPFSMAMASSLPNVSRPTTLSTFKLFLLEGDNSVFPFLTKPAVHLAIRRASVNLSG